jgi:hypothetical protein
MSAKPAIIKSQHIQQEEKTVKPTILDSQQSQNTRTE